MFAARHEFTLYRRFPAVDSLTPSSAVVTQTMQLSVSANNSDVTNRSEQLPTDGGGGGGGGEQQQTTSVESTVTFEWHLICLFMLAKAFQGMSSSLFDCILINNV